MAPDPQDLLDPDFVDYCPIDCEGVCRKPRLCWDARRRAEDALLPQIVLIHRKDLKETEAHD